MDILNKIRYINIKLYDNINNNNNDEYINKINELNKIIKDKDNKIKFLEDELNKYKNKDDNSYDDFNIEKKNKNIY